MTINKVLLTTHRQRCIQLRLDKELELNRYNTTQTVTLVFCRDRRDSVIPNVDQTRSFPSIVKFLEHYLVSIYTP